MPLLLRAIVAPEYLSVTNASERPERCCTTMHHYTAPCCILCCTTMHHHAAYCILWCTTLLHCCTKVETAQECFSKFFPTRKYFSATFLNAPTACQADCIRGGRLGFAELKENLSQNIKLSTSWCIKQRMFWYVEDWYQYPMDIIHCVLFCHFES